MIQSIYDSCLLHININDSSLDSHANLVQIDLKDDQETFLSRKNVFSLFDSANEVVALQTNNILIFANQVFADKKKKTIIEAKIMTKSREKLDSKNLIKFNDTIITRLENDDIYLNQITQSNHLQSIKKINVDTINSRNVIRLDLTSKKQSVTQRAREAYLTSIFQLEAFTIYLLLLNRSIIFSAILRF
jgi:hypothetical protein